LDLQKEHIDLLMDSKDVSREIAEYLFKRRQEILQDKKKTFKLKFSKKGNY
jgi:ribonuclease HI